MPHLAEPRGSVARSGVPHQAELRYSVDRGGVLYHVESRDLEDKYRVSHRSELGDSGFLLFLFCFGLGFFGGRGYFYTLVDCS